MRIFAQDQGARKIFRRPDLYSEDKIFGTTIGLGEKAILQGSHKCYLLSHHQQNPLPGIVKKRAAKRFTNGASSF
jgi:hypothetical protein